MTALAERLRAVRRPALRVRHVRRAIQVASLVRFLYLAVAAAVPLVSPLPVDLFFRIDPLVALATSLAGREVAPYALWALPVALATVFLGRAGVSFLPLQNVQRYSHALAGATILACGLAIQFLGL